MLKKMCVCSRTGRAGNKGYAYTFITPEQERYAGEIIRALELSEATVPQDVNKLWEDCKSKAKAVSFVCVCVFFFVCVVQCFPLYVSSTQDYLSDIL
jgi:hypothetical protein